MSQKAVSLCAPLGDPLEREFAIQFGDLEWVDLRRITELVEDFIKDLQSSARGIGLITQDESILTLRMVKADGSNLGDIDPFGTLGDILQYLGDRYLVAVLGPSNALQPPTQEVRVELSNCTDDEGNPNDQPRNIIAPAPTAPSADGGGSNDETSSELNEAVVLLTNKWGVLIRMTVANLSLFFNVSREELAQQLGISSNLFKKTITELGINRWPSQRMWILENTIQGLEFAIANGGFGKEVTELQSSLNSVRTKKDKLQHGSVEVINRMGIAKKSELVPSQVSQFLLYRVRWSFEENRAPLSHGNEVMEVFAVERSVQEPVGGEVHGVGVNAVGPQEGAGDQTTPMAAKSGRGRTREPGALAKCKPYSEAAGPSTKRGKRASRVDAMQHKGDSGSSDSD